MQRANSPLSMTKSGVFPECPYVSSLQRYVATMPGDFQNGRGRRVAARHRVRRDTGDRLAASARSVNISPLPLLPALASVDIGATDLAAIRNVAENFVRVSPVNLMTGASACSSCSLAHDPPVLVLRSPGHRLRC